MIAPPEGLSNKHPVAPALALRCKFGHERGSADGRSPPILLPSGIRGPEPAFPRISSAWFQTPDLDQSELRRGVMTDNQRLACRWKWNSLRTPSIAAAKTPMSANRIPVRTSVAVRDRGREI
tara:strand:+ start:509 stop:874 length:366 start_codon:yes stop_codon:yes gene_type:complete